MELRNCLSELTNFTGLYSTFGFLLHLIECEEMAEGPVKFLLRRLASLLLNEAETFNGIEGHVEKMISMLREIGEFCAVEVGKSGGVFGWIRELRDLIRDAEDSIDEFIIRMDEQKGSDRSSLRNGFVNKLLEVESRFAATVNRMMELGSLTSAVAEKQTSADAKPEADLEVAEDNKGTCNETEESHEEESCGIERSGTLTELASSCRRQYTSLPYYLKHCLMYCCLFPENHCLSKGKLIRLLIAEGLLQEKAGELMEDIAEENINELIGQGIFKVNKEYSEKGTMLTVSPAYRELIVRQMEEENLIASSSSPDFRIPQNSRHVLIFSNIEAVVPQLNNIRPRSLFLLGKQDLSTEHVDWLNFDGSKYLRVIDLEGTKINSLPDEVGDLIHLTYLGLKNTDIKEISTSVCNLRALETLDIKWSGNILALPVEILNLQRLRHLKMYRRMNVGGIKLPSGIEKFKNMLSLTGIHVGDGIARELSNLINLRRLGVMDVAEEDVSELFASIMMMQNLLNVSLEAKHSLNRETLILAESFSPPPLLRKLRLEGILKKLPNWFSSMENLTKLRLGFSHLSENPLLVLRLLPNLKILILWHAYEAKQLGKDFCRAGGFPKLEHLTVASFELEEWTELEEGALSCLKLLHLHSCSKLRMLPEGLQFVTTLKQLNLYPLLNEHEEKLKPGGPENYKISHIPEISFILMSKVRESFQSHPCMQREGKQSKAEE